MPNQEYSFVKPYLLTSDLTEGLTERVAQPATYPEIAAYKGHVLAKLDSGGLLGPSDFEPGPANALITSDNIRLDIKIIPDGSFLKRSGLTIVGGFVTLSELIFKNEVGQFGGWCAQSSGFGDYGLWDGVVVGSGTVSTSSSAEGRFLRSQTTTTLNAGAGYGTSGAPSNGFHRMNWTSALVIKFAMVETTGVRLFVGFTDTTSTATLAADNPAGASLAGLQFSTVRGDTAFQWATKDGTTLNLTSTGIAADTAIHFVLIELTATNVTFTLLDSTFSSQNSIVTTTNVPAAATDLGWISGVANGVGGAGTERRIDNYYAFGLNKV